MPEINPESEVADATQDDGLVEATDNGSLPEDGPQDDLAQEPIAEDAVELDDEDYEAGE